MHGITRRRTKKQLFRGFLRTRVSPLHSEDVIPMARSFLMSGVITDPDVIRQRLHQRGWEAVSVWGVVREVERAANKASR